ncbi:putative baseplate assembly protein [Candidatus Nitrotoga sp. M5]|uniref:putative baseplate assembly protein n=1 Tax=Candidatus Nitrotoga sp. M5 TaxID=2890409 RepID=UPI001EF40654|nr:putative baseplate assembly protein [Candidatus Nitrotoga sp. M5]CAH1388065.1 putative baseplate assembly protein [Candidatus Nitrotoga sp. M5]
MKYYCCDQRRREVVKLNGTLNGLEYLEVHDSGIPGDPTRQLTLFLKFLREVPASLDKNNFYIDGGERIKSVDIAWVAIANALPASEPPSLVDGLMPLDKFMVIRTKIYGDFSLYTLRLLSGIGSDTPPAGFDPRLSEIPFSFKVQCESDFDCASVTTCPTPPVTNPRLDYLAKDYASFRRLMLDRMSVLMPDWNSRNAADIGVTLVEILAYVGDQLSYQQDAVATEAYLATARKRISLRRHARLVDYRVHEGCNARVWVQLFANEDGVNIPRGTPLLTRVPNTPERIPPSGDQLRDALTNGALVFETVEDTPLYLNHERISFYSWGERECCLPKGSTRATLNGHYPNLKAGDVLVFAEELGPRTGHAADADRAHRWAVRLADVRLDSDLSGGLFLPVPNNNPLDVTEIRWVEQDALPFPLCLSTISDLDHGATYLGEVSAAYGNIVLADHGRTLTGEDLGAVSDSQLILTSKNDVLNCKRPPLQAVAPRFRPRLAERPLTHALPLTAALLFSFTATAAIVTALQTRSFTPALHDALQAQGVLLQAGTVKVQGGDGMWSLSDGISAYRLRLDSGQVQVSPLAEAATLITAVEPQRARPAITLSSTFQGTPDTWLPLPDLLASNAEASKFVVESEHDGSALLRFGDDYHGKRPDVSTTFNASYRIGNGVAGNIGLESIAHIVSNDARLLRASNPLPAQGGSDPEKAEDIRRDAPEAFRTQERAVTPADYAEVTERHPSVQRAAATFRWTGSWYTVFLTVDRKGGGEVDAVYEQTIREHVERYRMAGYDLEVNGPTYIPLLLDMKVCVKPDYFRADVRVALMRVFSRGWLTDGTPALFHPDNFSFGQAVYLSTLYEAAQSVQGVDSVVINTFQRLRAPPDPKPMDDGVLTVGRLEIARLDNDPNFPERGVLKLSIGGGK